MEHESIGRVEEFTRDGRNFIYIDLSNLRTNEDFIKITGTIEPLIANYPGCSVYTITNIENVRFDTDSKKLFTRYMEHNKPYVKYGAVFGLDGIKKIMASTVFAQSGRKNMVFAFSKEQAIELLLKQK